MLQVCKIEFSSKEALDAAATFQARDSRYSVLKLEKAELDRIQRDSSDDFDYCIAGLVHSLRNFH